MKSTSGYSGYFSWCSKMQDIAAQSTAEADFIAATAAIKQALWLRKILIDLDLEQQESTEVFLGNQAAIATSHNPVFHARTKHFNIRLYFFREVQEVGQVKLVYCRSEDQVADLFTKPFHVSRFEFLRRKLKSLQFLKQECCCASIIAVLFWIIAPIFKAENKCWQNKLLSNNCFVFPSLFKTLLAIFVFSSLFSASSNQLAVFSSFIL